MRHRFTGLWRHPEFLKLWVAQSVSLLGTQVTALALPLTAVLVLDASPAEMGLLTALTTLPFLLFGLFAGVWVDRVRRRPVLMTADVGRALLLGSIPIAAGLDQLSIEQMYAVALLTGILTVFFDVAYQAYLPSLIDRSELVDGNSKLELSSSVGRVAGPGLGGALVQVMSAPTALLVDALSFVASALFLGLIRRQEPAPVRRAAGGSVWREIGEGLQLVFRHPLLRPIVVSTAVSNLCTGVVTGLLLLYLSRTLNLSPSVIGIAYAIGSLGAVCSAFVAGAIVRRYGLGPSIIAGKILIALSAIVLAIAGGPPVVAATMLIISRLLGSGTILSNVGQVSLRQTVAPDRLQGRVNATNRFVTWATLPLGSLAGGVIAEAIGVRPTMLLAAVGITVAALGLLLSPLPGVHEAPHPEPDDEMVPAR